MILIILIAASTSANQKCVPTFVRLSIADPVALPSEIGFGCGVHFGVQCANLPHERNGGIMFSARAGFGTFSKTAEAAVNPLARRLLRLAVLVACLCSVMAAQS